MSYIIIWYSGKDKQFYPLLNPYRGLGFYSTKKEAKRWKKLYEEASKKSNDNGYYSIFRLPIGREQCGQ